MKTNSQNNNSGLKNRSEQLSTRRSTEKRNAFAERKDQRLPIDQNQRKTNRALSTAKVLDLLTVQLPDVYRLAEVVGKWVWVQFQEIPAAEIRQALAQLGFHWNRARQAWQHPCGQHCEEAATVDPRQKYGSYFAADIKAA